jgi:hypothetical protein
MSRTKKKNTSPMKVILPIIAVLVILALAVGAMLVLKHKNRFHVDASTVFILDKGKVVTTDIETFDTGKYNLDELTAYLTKIIDTYNGKHGENSVVQKEYLVENNKATLILEYANTDIYEDFYGIELFSGTVSEALKAGYAFDVDFAAVSEEGVTACDKEDITSQTELKCVIIKANTRVQVDGKILYVSAENVYEYGKNYVVSKDKYNIFELGVEEGTENTTGTEETDTTTESVDDSMIIEDGVLVGTTETESTESTEIIFDFGDEKEDKEDNTETEVSQKYIYIIYK